jgi:hypothetical protein
VNLLEVQPGESVAVCKRGKGVWDVWLTPETEKLRSAKEAPGIEQQLRASVTEINQRRYNVLELPKENGNGNGRAEVSGAGVRPAPVSQSAAPVKPEAAQHDTFGQVQNSNPLVDECNALVDTFAEVLERALKTYEGRVKPDEVQRLVTTVYIQRKGGKGARDAA